MKTRRFLVVLAAVLFCTTAAMAKDIRTAVFKVAQMKCENCVRKINNNIRFEKGLKKFDTDLKTKTVTITYDADKTNVEKLKEGFRKFHYEAEFVKETKQDDKK
ncbi:heavy-metal-associated domain-containing protein [uncultured Bacteroides sp.]|uniref:heavy-metal-associated domain-containing protein n=1 Tax=uncultured Bacteroides sp. TaxID=162156 RepID=UPI00266FB22F|nr:heavy-metal-associated domain-containing protein [uncultured Bacteroides sp.]